MSLYDYFLLVQFSTKVAPPLLSYLGMLCIYGFASQKVVHFANFGKSHLNSNKRGMLLNVGLVGDYSPTSVLNARPLVLFSFV